MTKTTTVNHHPLGDQPNDSTSVLHKGANTIGDNLRHLLADIFALYLKTKNFHWHMSGAHFRDYHRLLDEQGGQLFEMTDAIAERGRKLGAQSIHSIGEIARAQRIRDNDDTELSATAMLGELRADNQMLAAIMRDTHQLCDQYGDVATASLLENWIDEAEGRTWFLAQTGQPS
jgi:starvation-inducible DNA-binding protein